LVIVRTLDHLDPKCEIVAEKLAPELLDLKGFALKGEDRYYKTNY